MTSTKPRLDILAVGESLRDVFYLIDDATLSCSINKDRCLLCLEYADKIPVRQVVKVPAAGNSANAAVGAARLGLRTGLISWVGDDYAGRHLREALRKEKVDLKFLVEDKKLPTSEATIINYQGEKTQLVYFQPRSYSVPECQEARCLYYSAMGAKHASVDKKIFEFLGCFPAMKLVFQPGTTHIKSGLTAIKKLIAKSHMLILNKDEAEQLLADGERTMCSLLDKFIKLGAKTAIITDGKNGADAFDGKTHWHMPAFDGKPVETTGAGDSFACGVTVAMLKGLDMEEALRWGSANAWSVIHEIGPQKGLLASAGMKKVLKKFSKIKAETHRH
ncbi:MAG: carbohydrate kinase family protein [Patescibacteria group bacterium]|nr:carbohydrate kinase family protein [Patescibacteria group bacterium]